MVRVAVLLTLIYVAVIVLVVLDMTLDVVIVKLAEVAPAGTVTDAGTVAAAFELFSVTTAPFIGAARSSVTVPVELFPPTTLVGASVTDMSAACC